MRTLTRRIVATASIVAVTLALASGSTTAASAEVPSGVEVLFARSWTGAPGNWDGTSAATGALQVEFGFRVANPTLTLRDGMFYELPGVRVDALADGSPTQSAAMLDCSVPAPATLDSLTPLYADVHCYGSVKPADGANGEGRFIAVTPTASGPRSFAVDWLTVAAT